MINNSEHKQTVIVAENGIDACNSKDPFPLIPSALLNSADILAYAKKIPFITPFYEKDLMGAAYDVRIKGEVVYFDRKGKHNMNLDTAGKYFDLEPNSIAFVTLEPVFHIPLYMAFRFNLKITHVYKGLLLGTGPLVDPGFHGKLSIPLHNLTKNRYRFYVDEPLIQMEFTKLSPNRKWNTENSYSHQEKYKENTFDKQNRTVEEFIQKALKKDFLSSVISSIPDAMERAKKDAEIAKKTVKQLERRADSITKFGIVAVAALIITCIGFSWNLIANLKDQYIYLQEKVLQQQNIIQEYRERIESLEEGTPKR